MTKTSNSKEAGLKAYSRIAIFLHWLMAVLLVGMLITGEQTMGNHRIQFLPSLHTSLGLILFFLVCVRLFCRLRRSPPAPLAQNRIEALAARAVHTIMYIAMFLIPLTGWLAYTEHVRRSFGVQPARWFGTKIPLLPDYGINWHLIHNWGGKLFLALIALHAFAALKHHFIDRDDTLRRILR